MADAEDDTPDAAPDAADRTVMAAPEPSAADPTVVGAQPAQASKPEVRLVEAGTLINNNYRILGLVSAGGMGEVYRAENVFTGDPVAVKVILPGLANDEAVLDMFRREARVLVQLRDESIVRYHNFVLDPGLGRYCLIMEFVEGRHLGDRLKQDGPLAEAEVLALTRRIGTGLMRAHDRGVTHRDLSPDNVILRDDRIDEAVLIDFGIARSTELGDGLAGRFAGKFKYIAPEQLGHWGGEIGPRTDVYGLALLVAATARGKPLDMGDSVVSASAARQGIPDLTGISHRLFPLLQHMLEPDPARRPADMGAVLRMLDDPSLIPSRYRLPLWSQGGDEPPVAEGLTGSFGQGSGLGGPAHSASPFGASLPPPPVEAPEAPQPVVRSRWPLVAAAAVLLAAAGGVSWLMLRPAGVAPPPEPPAAADLVPRDASTREGFLAAQPLPACVLADRIAAGPNAGQIRFLGPADLDPAPVVAAYGGRFGVSPSVQRGLVSDAQCPTLAFLREIAGRPAPPVMLQAQASAAGDRLQIRGSVDAGEGRNLWLLIVPPSGEIYDLSSQLGDAGGGGRSFGFALSQGPAGTGSYLLIALATNAPIAAVAAAPSGVPAEELLPRVLEELRAAGEAPSIAVQPIAMP
ncbi:serine/threonine-protein kinase [Paracoccus sp. TOH]|uniref:serine/threonine-protein kinase n=1 Tax=Paracoccus sp. TOH TaxID=1263728 RepID=UPI0025B25DEB|nr:serine/threonine-protein kinase [Paracoccus sp. TOH]WJS86873.1 serine/threonine protein kinase [Paracoccus sp. TOH]